MHEFSDNLLPDPIIQLAEKFVAAKNS